MDMQKTSSRTGQPLLKPHPLHMADKQLKHYRLDGEVISRIAKESKSTGRTATRVIEDSVMRRRQFSPHVEELIEAKLREKPQWSHNDVLEWAVLRVLGKGDTEPLKEANVP